LELSIEAGDAGVVAVNEAVDAFDVFGDSSSPLGSKLVESHGVVAEAGWLTNEASRTSPIERAKAKGLRDAEFDKIIRLRNLRHNVEIIQGRLA
jgi:hypothetical protein